MTTSTKTDAGPPTGRGTPASERSALERVLGLIAEVHPKEGPSALLLMMNVFLLLAGYYFLKSAREGLILGAPSLHVFGLEIKPAEVKTYASAGQATLLVLVVFAYGWLGRRMAPIKLITAVTLFFAANLVLFSVLASARAQLGIPFFLWVGIFNVTAIAQFWAFANDLYTPEQGKRLFAIVGVGASSGAVAGAYAVKPIVEAVKAVIGPGLGIPALMLIATALLLVSLALTLVVHRRERATAAARSPAPAGAQGAAGAGADRETLGKKGGFALLLEDRYLLLIGVLTLLLNWVNTNGEFILDRTLTEAMAGQHLTEQAAHDQITIFKADYFFWVNLIGMLLQLFAVSRIFKYLGVRRAVFILPLISLAGSSVLAFLPALAFIRLAKIAENSSDYSIQSTTRQALWLITSRDAKYKAKAAVDTFLVRIGDLASALLVLLGSQAVLAFATRTFVLVNLGLIALWLLAAVGISRVHKQRSGDTETGSPTSAKPS